MKEEKIKEAFKKVKHDITCFRQDIDSIKQDVFEIKQVLSSLADDLYTKKLQKLAYEDNSTYITKNSTDTVNSTHNSTVPQEMKGLKSPNFKVSTGNEGVSTDRQTDTSTDSNQGNTSLFNDFYEPSIEGNIQKASKILDSLDGLKKQLRLKFKSLTTQEMSVFSTIYQLEEKDPSSSNYKVISQSLKLSESSIRDYVQRIINKGIPVKKSKLDNKKVLLSISPDLKKVASLSTIINLRDL